MPPHKVRYLSASLKDSDGSAQVGMEGKNFQTQQTHTALQCCKAASSALQTGVSHTMAEAVVLRPGHGAT